MRVLVFCGDRGIPLLGPSGSSAHLRSVAAALTRRGHDVVVATPWLADHRGAVAEPCTRVATAAPRAWRWLGPWRERGETWDARRLARAAETLGPFDLIWERHALFVDAGQRLADALGIPRVVELDAPLSRERATVRDPARARALEARSLVAADRVVAVSTWLARWALDQGADPARVRHVPNGTDVRPADRAVGRRRFGLDGPVAAWVGSCKPWHGLSRLPALAEALPDWTIAVAGDGPEPVPAHPRIRALGRVTGEALDHLLAAADVGLGTGDPDRMPWVCPLKLLDYRAAGLPIATTASGDSARLVAHDDVVVDPWDPDAAARAIRSVAGPRRVWVRSWDTVVDEALADLPPR